MSNAELIIAIKNLSRVYSPKEESEVRALQGADFQIKKGEFVAIAGPSGSGKSTLLHILGLLDKPDTGEYFLQGKKVDQRTKPKVLAKLRLRKIGFVFQTYNLIPRISALSNVELPMIYAKTEKSRQKALELLKLVGLEKRAHHPSGKLSGGERQRVAIARALANDPEIILADEPTGNLDSKTGRQILEILKKLHRQGKTLIIVTHDKTIARRAQRIINIKDGKIL